jgi:hypothetical protein
MRAVLFIATIIFLVTDLAQCRKLTDYKLRIPEDVSQKELQFFFNTTKHGLSYAFNMTRHPKLSLTPWDRYEPYYWTVQTFYGFASGFRMGLYWKNTS